MQKTKKRVLSIFLAVMMATTMLVALPAKAFADPPDLVIEITRGSDPTGVVFTGVANPDAAADRYVFGSADVPASDLYTVGDDKSSLLSEAILTFPSTPYTVGYAIGAYAHILELADDGELLNYASIQITNDMKGPVTPGATTITGGVEKVTVADCVPVAGCQLFLVPEALYPTGGGAIALDDPDIIEVTGNGEIAGLAAGDYALYTVYTALHVLPLHDGYIAGTPVTVTSAGPFVCKIGANEYLSLNDALVAANSGDTITFLADISEITNIVVNSGDKLTFDLNGFDWELLDGGIWANGGTVNVINGGTVTSAFLDASNKGIVDFNADYVGGDGIFAQDAGTKVTVNGNVNANGFGLSALDGAVINAKGDVTVSGSACEGVVALTKGKVNLTGNVSVKGDDSVGVFAGAGSPQNPVGATINIDGNVTAKGTDAIGAWAEWGSKITIEGKISAPIYISFGDLSNDGGTTFYTVNKTKAENDATSKKSGYMQYSVSYVENGVDITDYVWVGNKAVGPGNNDEPADTTTVPGTGDTVALMGGASALMLALMGAGALLIARRRQTSSIL